MDYIRIVWVFKDHIDFDVLMRARVPKPWAEASKSQTPESTD